MTCSMRYPSAPAPIVVGAVFDLTGSYSWALIGLCVALALTVVLFWLLKPYPYPVKAKTEHVPPVDTGIVRSVIRQCGSPA